MSHLSIPQHISPVCTATYLTCLCHNNIPHLSMSQHTSSVYTTIAYLTCLYCNNILYLAILQCTSSVYTTTAYLTCLYCNKRSYMSCLYHNTSHLLIQQQNNAPRLSIPQQHTWLIQQLTSLLYTVTTHLTCLTHFILSIHKTTRFTSLHHNGITHLPIPQHTSPVDNTIITSFLGSISTNFYLGTGVAVW